jgi:hypothetical protein
LIHRFAQLASGSPAGLLVTLVVRPSLQCANRVDEPTLIEQDVKQVLGQAVACANLCMQQIG